jgi:hypothetical protein
MRGVVFGTLNNIFFQQNTSPYISHDTGTIMTPNDTGGIEIVPDHSVSCNTEVVIFMDPLLVQNV